MLFYWLSRMWREENPLPTSTNLFHFRFYCESEWTHCHLYCLQCVNKVIKTQIIRWMFHTSIQIIFQFILFHTWEQYLNVENISIRFIIFTGWKFKKITFFGGHSENVFLLSWIKKFNIKKINFVKFHFNYEE